MSDLDDLMKYWNTYEMRRFLGSTLPMSRQKEREWMERATKLDPVKDGEFILAIVDKETNEFLGTIGFMDISSLARHAEFGITIHNSENWGKGYGTDATLVTLWIGFNVLGLNTIYLRAFAHNKRGIKTYEKCGFKMAGTLREHVFSEGEFQDHVIMDITAAEFFERYPTGTHIGRP